MTAPTAPRRVLIVDDEPANIHALAEALHGLYDLRFATDGVRALELAASCAFDLVLLDVVMPGLDGYEILERLKHDPATSHVPVIFVTSMGEAADEARGLAQGAVDYITKPVSPPIVRARAATHIQLKLQRDLLERRASIDGLTGIANRRRFDEELDLRWHRAQHDGQPLGLLLLDVDHFKQFNDSYGHVAGDECLRRVAAALEATFGGSDELAARVGGEEFAVLLPPGDGARHARKLLEAVRALAIPHAHSSAGPWVSVSAGAVHALPAPDVSPRRLLEAADALLYAAKSAGRNRCVLETSPAAPRQVIAL